MHISQNYKPKTEARWQPSREVADRIHINMMRPKIEKEINKETTRILLILAVIIILRILI